MKDGEFVNSAGIKIGTVVVDGYGNFMGKDYFGNLFNYGTIDLATVDAFGRLTNTGSVANIKTVIVTGVGNNQGWLTNSGKANIETAIVNRSGYLQNNTASKIESVTVHSGGTLINSDTNTRIEKAFLYGGVITNEAYNSTVSTDLDTM